MSNETSNPTGRVVKVAGPVKLSVRLRASAAGQGQVQWRTADQETFADDQVVSFGVSGGGEWREVEVKLPVRGQLLHIRIYPPPASLPADIASIELAAETSPQPDRRWDFTRAE